MNLRWRHIIGAGTIIVMLCSAGLVIKYYTSKNDPEEAAQIEACKTNSERLTLSGIGISYSVPPGYRRLDSIYFDGSGYGSDPSRAKYMAVLTRSTDAEVQQWKVTSKSYRQMRDIAPPALSNGKTIIIDYRLQDPAKFKEKVEEKQSASITEKSKWQSIKSCGGLSGVRYQIGQWGGTAELPRYVTVFPFDKGSIFISLDSPYNIEAADVEAYTAIVNSLQ